MPKLGKTTGARLIFESDPEALINNCIAEYRDSHYLRPSTFVEEKTA